LTSGAAAGYVSSPMSVARIRIVLARHGETAWAVAGRHTGRTDLPLTPAGEREALKLGERLRRRTFAAVFSSPLQRAKRTCELAGFGAAAEILPDLMEWHYGDYEGLTSAQIRVRAPGWRLFRDGCPGGERLKDVVARVDRVLRRLRDGPGDSLVFAHGHILRVLASRGAGLPASAGERLHLSTASLSVLARDVGADQALIERWNDVCHLEG
jgi:broad specificity phosphatase PhoE